MSGSAQEQSVGATIYSVVGSFIGAAAGGAWIGIVLMSFAGLYGNIPLWKDLIAGAAAGTVVAVLAIVCGRSDVSRGSAWYSWRLSPR